MLKLTIARWLAALLLGLVGVLTVPGQARAAAFVGAFDPAYGGAYPNLGFRGQATFFIPDACLNLNGEQSLAQCPGMTVTSAFVNFYDIRAVGTPTLFSRNYVPPVQSLLHIILAGGNLTAVDTDPLGPRYVNVPDDFPGGQSLLSGNTWLEFEDGIQHFEGDFNDPAAYLLACSGEGCPLNLTTRSNPAPVRFTRIPEPSSIALVLAALAIAGFARRRRGFHSPG